MAQERGSVLDAPVSERQRRVGAKSALSWQPMPSEADDPAGNLKGLDLGECGLGFDFGPAISRLWLGQKPARAKPCERCGQLNEPYDPFVSFFPPILLAMFVCEYVIPFGWKMFLAVFGG